MKRSASLKTLLLGGAASLAMFAQADAADMPTAEPVDYVRVCSTYGAGFWYIPGTDTCLQIGGYVRFQLYSHVSNVNAKDFEGDPLQIIDEDRDSQEDTLAFYSRGLLNFDARTETSYGTLRSFIQIRGTAIDVDGVSYQLDKGFLQFAGVTAGLAPSFFIIENPVDYFGTHNTDFAEDQLVLAYTYESTNKEITATVAIESADRATLNGAGAAAFLAPVFDDDDGDFDGFAAQDATRTEYPVGVANFRIKQAWGSATVAGAVAEAKERLTFAETVVDDETTTIFARESNESEIGWAVAGGVVVNLPFLGKDDSGIVKVGYSDGLNFYTLGSGGVVPPSITFVGPEDIETAETFTIFGGLVHNWTDTIRSNIGVGFFDLDFNYGEGDHVSGGTVTANIIWSPVKNLNIGLELIYAHVEADAEAATLLDIGDGDELDEDAFGALFRIQRNFGS